MIRGLYTAASGMIATLMANDTLANNLANVNTTGFKKNTTSFSTFPEMLIHKMQGGESKAVGSIMTGGKVHETAIRFEQGHLSETGNDFDLALEGDGFFTLKDNNDNTYYTRAGNFTVSAEGYVVNQQGHVLQGRLGGIQVNLDNGPFRFGRDGLLTAGQREVDQLKIARFEDNHQLTKVGDTLFQAKNGFEPLPEPQPGELPDYVLHQGLLERSNTNVIEELVNTIQGTRLYDTLQRNVKMHNEMTGKAVNEVGRYR